MGSQAYIAWIRKSTLHGFVSLHCMISQAYIACIRKPTLHGFIARHSRDIPMFILLENGPNIAQGVNILAPSHVRL